MKGVTMIHPTEAYKAAGQHARRAERTGTRLAFSVIGFSAAYFLDPEHGASRRKQARGFLRRTRQAIASARAVDEKPTYAMADSLVPESPATGAPFPTEGLKIAR
jgi:hypothetical protein